MIEEAGCALVFLGVQSKEIYIVYCTLVNSQCEETEAVCASPPQYSGSQVPSLVYCN